MFLCILTYIHTYIYIYTHIYQVADDDDVLIIIAPQNTVNGECVTLLDDMCKAAKGKPVVLINPKLGK
jgi:hypothetical protein